MRLFARLTSSLHHHLAPIRRVGRVPTRVLSGIPSRCYSHATMPFPRFDDGDVEISLSANDEPWSFTVACSRSILHGSKPVSPTAGMAEVSRGEECC